MEGCGFGIEFAHDFCVGEFLEPIGGDVFIVDDEEGVDEFDVRAFHGQIGAYALTQVV